MEPVYISLDVLVARLGIDKPTARRWIARGTLPIVAYLRGSSGMLSPLFDEPRGGEAHNERND